MKNIILYGGAFNPPTIAHQAILQACVDHALSINAEVWLMPSGTRTDKAITTDLDMRLQLVNALVDSVENNHLISVCDFELRNERLTETFETHDYLTRTYKDRTFIWVFGSDSIATMKEWGEGERLWNELDQLILQRHGYEVDVLPPKAKLLSVTTPKVSSTEVRECLSAGKSIVGLVPKEVRAVLI